MFEYILLSFGSLFVIVDPLATLPAFLAMTPLDTAEQRIRTARLACIVATAILLFFALTGGILFKVMGITMPAFQIAASILLLIVALDMLRAQRSRVQETREETQAGSEKTDIAVTPLAIPMISGPGAISTIILLQNQAKDIGERIALYGVIVAVMGATYLAGLAVGYWPDKETIARQWQMDRVFKPTMDRSARDKVRATWKRALGRARDWAREEEAAG